MANCMQNGKMIILNKALWQIVSGRIPAGTQQFAATVFIGYDNDLERYIVDVEEVLLKFYVRTK